MDYSNLKAIVFDFWGVLADSDDEDGLNQQLIEIVKKLKEKYKIGLLSNTAQSYSEEFIFKTGIDKLFDVLALSYQLRLRKPDPEIYQYVINKLGLKPFEILYIDDQQTSLSPARELGWQTMLYEGEKTNEVLRTFIKSS